MFDVSSLKIPDGLVYLDNNATTACFPEVVAAMQPYWNLAFGNASSSHFSGRLVGRVVGKARESVASALDIDQGQVFFNSGATEGNNWIFQAFADSRPAMRRVVVSTIEHKSVLNAAKRLERFGFDVSFLPVTSDGAIDLGAARKAIIRGTGLVSVQLANNETGVIQPVRELVEMAHAAGAFFHCDAVQALGKMPFSLSELGVDSATFSAHKIHGPKGIGILYLRSGAYQFPFPMPIEGGGQERSVRPGTLNVPGIVGLAKAMEMLPDENTLTRMQAMRDAFEASVLAAISGSFVNGAGANRLPNTTNFFIPGVPSDVIMDNMPLFCVSNGSACNTGAFEPSYVLQSMGLSQDFARHCIRISTSALTQIEDISSFSAELVKTWRQLI